MNTIDWTDYFDRKIIVDPTHTIIEEIIESIHAQKFSIHTRHKLTVDELALLYRWPIYISVNTFIERYIRLVCLKETKAPNNYSSVKGITFYAHGETPGLGAEISKEWFQSNFIGKELYNGNQLISIK